ncbi:hypothetical protein M9458_043777 [Cirrhinus mrigala]|uniref:Uncharacterized protein n=1 Tax=Cirrhinus mrigala TaxID=683832 RepID=A0ABD0NDF8_CIRMR
MNDPAVLVLLLEQGDRFLEDHITDFVFLANLAHRHTSATSLAALVKLVLVGNSPLTVDFMEDDTSATLDPESSQPSPLVTEHEPEPTAEGEPEPSATDKPSPKGATVLRIAPEPEPITSDQVRELATSHTTVKVTVEREGAEESTHPLQHR